jgi:hypothetical protein
MVTRLRHVAVVQLALVLAIMYAVAGVIVGLAWWLIISPIMLAGMKSTMGNSAAGMGMLAGMGFFAVITFPIVYGMIGFVAGLIYAALYNLAARWTGGVEMTFEQVPVATV